MGCTKRCSLQPSDDQLENTFDGTVIAANLAVFTPFRKPVGRKDDICAYSFVASMKVAFLTWKTGQPCACRKEFEGPIFPRELRG